MRILITLAAAAALMAGLVVGIVLAATLVTRSGSGTAAAVPVTEGGLAKIAYAVLWCIVAGSAAGLIGSG